MGYPVCCAENLLDTVAQYRAHTLTANEEAPGHDAWRAANTRTHESDYWTPTTANAAAYLQVDFDRPRAFNFVALSPNHNVAGYGTRLRISDDDFTTYEDVLAITQPAAYGPGSSLDAAVGARTYRGAWVKTFDLRIASSVRFVVDAMGAGLRPRITGLWLGLAWSPGEYLVRSVTPYPRSLDYPVAESGAGWRGSGRVVARRAGDYRIRLRTHFADEAERFLQRYSPHAPAWIIPDSDRAEEAFLAAPPSGAGLGLEYEPRWGYPVATVPFIEHEPR